MTSQRLGWRIRSFLAVPFLFLALPTTVQAQFTCYTNNEGQITILGYTWLGDTVAIPSMINDLPVTGIEAFAFADNASLTSVTIGSGLTNLGDRAFLGCARLKTVFFAGNAPSVAPTLVFDGLQNATVSYLPGTSGWRSIFSGLRTVLWNPRIQVGDGSFGVGASVSTSPAQGTSLSWWRPPRM